MKNGNSCGEKLNSNENVDMEKGKASIILELIGELSGFVYTKSGKGSFSQDFTRYGTELQNGKAWDIEKLYNWGEE